MSKILGNSEELNSVVNVGTYGAVGDGTTDDTTAIQAALSSTSKVIEFTSGKTYLVNGALTSAVENRTIIATGATIKLKNSATNYRIITISGALTIVEGGDWDGNRDNQSAGDAFTSFAIGVSGDFCKITNARFINWRGTGVKGANCSQLLVDNCLFTSIGNGNATCYGVYMEATTASRFGNKVINSKFYMSDSGTSGQPILFTSTITSGGFGQYDWEISGNYVEGSSSVSNADQAICMAVRGARGIVNANNTKYGSMGWSEGGDDTVISNNIFDSTTGTVRWGIEPSGSRVVISNNQIRDHGRGITPTSQVFSNDDLVITGNYIEVDNTYSSGTLGGPRCIDLASNVSAGTTCNRITVTGNTLRGKTGINATRIVTDWVITGNEFIGPGSGTVNGRGIFFNSPSTALRWNISSNKFNGFERAVGVYNLTGDTITDIQFVNNNCVNDVGGGSTSLINVEGSAVLGTRVVTFLNATSSANFNWYYDRAANVKIEISNSYATPESNVSASIGSQYFNTAGSGGTTMFLKESGANTNTGWTRVGSTQQFANGTVSVPSVQSKAFSSTGLYFPSANTIGFTSNATQVSTMSDSAINFNLNTIRITTSKTPSGPTDTGSAGQIGWDPSYLYVCTSANNWTRIPLSW